MRFPTQRLLPRMTRVAALWLALGMQAHGLNIRDHYSPRNAERPRREQTRYIVLHTTEGPAAGSIRKIHARGEAHYVVDTDGSVLRIVHRDRVAFHAGRSMWDGKTDLDLHSLGIEVVGYHNRAVTEKQIAALRELLRQLQRIYRIPDERVLTHSMVAYGAPNRWHRRPHRGRKRCGMLFARPSMRRKLGLARAPTQDPDVRAGRLIEADPHLAEVLYGGAAEARAATGSAVNGQTISATRTAWDIARDQYNCADTVYVFPDGRQRRGDQISNWHALPVGTRVSVGQAPSVSSEEQAPRLGHDGASARAIAGDASAESSTFYILPDSTVRQGSRMRAHDFKQLPAGTRVLVDYAGGQTVTARRSAFDICGPRWNHPSTYYRFPNGAVKQGHEVNEGAIPSGSQVFYRR